MKLAVALVAGAIAFAGMSTPAMAWTELAVRDVADRTDHDAISLPGNRHFDHIKLCVYRNPIRFYDLRIDYRNGGSQDANVRARINPGQCTRAIDLNGGERNIDRISMTYEETSWRHRTATVRVFGE